MFGFYSLFTPTPISFSRSQMGKNIYLSIDYSSVVHLRLISLPYPLLMHSFTEPRSHPWASLKSTIVNYCYYYHNYASVDAFCSLLSAWSVIFWCSSSFPPIETPAIIIPHAAFWWPSPWRGKWREHWGNNGREVEDISLCTVINIIDVLWYTESWINKKICQVAISVLKSNLSSLKNTIAEPLGRHYATFSLQNNLKVWLCTKKRLRCTRAQVTSFQKTPLQSSRLWCYSTK